MIEAVAAVIAVGVAFATVTSAPILRSSQRSGPGWSMSFLSGSLFALAILPLVATLDLSTPGLILALWLLLFVLGFLLSMIEAIAFAEGPSPVRVRDMVGAAAAAGVAASVAACLIHAPSSGSLTVNLGRWIDEVGGSALALRFLGTAVAFMVAYCVIGSVTWRFVRPFYEDPKLGLRLRVPSGHRVILLQLGRGTLAILALAPLLASSSAHGFDGWARLALALAVTAAVIPLLGAAGWPAKLRVIHGVEIAVFELVYAFALLRILAL